MESHPPPPELPEPGTLWDIDAFMRELEQPLDSNEMALFKELREDSFNRSHEVMQLAQDTRRVQAPRHGHLLITYGSVQRGAFTRAYERLRDVQKCEVITFYGMRSQAQNVFKWITTVALSLHHIRDAVEEPTYNEHPVDLWTVYCGSGR